MKKYWLWLFLFVIGCTGCGAESRPREINVLQKQQSDLSAWKDIIAAEVTVQYPVYVQYASEDTLILDCEPEEDYLTLYENFWLAQGFMQVDGPPLPGSVVSTEYWQKDHVLLRVVSVQNWERFRESATEEMRYLKEIQETGKVLIVKKAISDIEKSSPSLVSMAIEEKTAEGIKISIIHALDETLTFGSFYVLEQYLDGHWFPVDYIIEKDAIGWHDIAYEVAPGEIFIWETDWRGIYGSLGVGQYRLGKGYFPSGDCKNKSMLFVEFSIEEGQG